MCTFSVERVVSGAGWNFTTEPRLEKGTLDQAILAYLKAIHTGHPAWIVNDVTGLKLTNEEIEEGLELLLKSVMV